MPDRNVSVGIFMDDTYMVGSTETPRDIHYFGDIKKSGVGTFNALKTTGRFQILHPYGHQVRQNGQKPINGFL